MLVLNVGNTNVRWVEYAGDAIVRDVRIATGAIAEAPLPALLAGCPVVIVSVVPAASEILGRRLSGHAITPVRARDLGDLRVAYQPPGALGPDRFCDALAMQARTGWGIAIDCGTATTFTVVTPDGVLVGGAIMPGLGTARASLHRGTALLPEVPLEPFDRPWADQTVGALQLGLIEGHLGAIERLTARMAAALPAEAPRLLTGGWSQLLAGQLGAGFTHVPDLTIEGARLAYQLSTGH